VYVFIVITSLILTGPDLAVDIRRTAFVNITKGDISVHIAFVGEEFLDIRREAFVDISGGCF
ncbi:hypothetical protein BgiBS90_027336, partial [Biomphalaria glabrata]